jgi:4-hydroxybenzoate polyprenyltransferase
MTNASRLKLYIQLTRLDKPIGILLLLWPTLWGLWFAGQGRPALMIVAIFVLGTVLMRSAGCVINDYADRDVDPHVERTQHRPLAAKKLSTREALALAATLALAAFLIILPLNALTLMMSVPALLLAASYPFSKRFFALPQAWLGIAFGFGIPMAFAAIQNAVPPLAWLLLAANMFWSIAYDTEYAMVDREDDLKIGIHTSAITFARFDVAAVMVCYALALALLAAAGMMAARGVVYFSGLAAAALIALYHYTLIRKRDRAACFKAFLHNNWFGAAIFTGLLADYLMPPG